jgi:nucleoside phosphorylase
VVVWFLPLSGAARQQSCRNAQDRQPLGVAWHLCFQTINTRGNTETRSGRSNPDLATIRAGVSIALRTTAAITVVVTTALELEYAAIREYIAKPRRITHAAGTIFELGPLSITPQVNIVIAISGEGTTTAGIIKERAITTFSPTALLFVEVAGSLKSDISLGDIVVRHKDLRISWRLRKKRRAIIRPRAWDAPHDLEQEARFIARAGSCRELLSTLPEMPAPNGRFKPIAAGEVVLNSRTKRSHNKLRATTMPLPRSKWKVLGFRWQRVNRSFDNTMPLLNPAVKLYPCSS